MQMKCSETKKKKKKERLGNNDNCGGFYQRTKNFSFIIIIYFFFLFVSFFLMCTNKESISMLTNSHWDSYILCFIFCLLSWSLYSLINLRSFAIRPLPLLCLFSSFCIFFFFFISYLRFVFRRIFILSPSLLRSALFKSIHLPLMSHFLNSILHYIVIPFNPLQNQRIPEGKDKWSFCTWPRDQYTTIFPVGTCHCALKFQRHLTTTNIFFFYFLISMS